MGKKNTTEWQTWEDMPVDEFARRVKEIRRMISDLTEAVEAKLPGNVTLTAEQRQSLPRLQNGEREALEAVLDTVDCKPELFADLADEDDGMDPRRFETELLRSRIAKHKILSELAEALAPLSNLVSDAPLYLAGRFRPAILAAYRVAKTHAENNQTMSTKLAPAVDFYSKRSRLAAVTRRAKKAQKGEG